MISYRDYKKQRWDSLTEQMKEDIKTNPYASAEYQKTVQEEYHKIRDNVLKPSGYSQTHLLNKVGYLEVTEEVYQEFWRNMPKGLLIPLEITFSYRKNCFIIWVYSDLFDEVQESDKLTQYMPVFLRYPNGTVEFQRFDKV